VTTLKILALLARPPPGWRKKIPLTPPKTSATLQSLTVETAYKEMTRYGSKVSYAYDRYRVEPDSRMLGQLVRVGGRARANRCAASRGCR
jgi:hypothetical protein